MNLDPHQLARGPKRPPNANDWSNIFDPAHEEILANMFGRIDDPQDNFPAGLVFLRSSLFAPYIGRTINANEVPAVLSCASQITDTKLVVRCLYTLEQITREGLPPEAHRLYSDAQRVLAELKARHPEVVEAREESRKRLREQKEALSA